jgi:hypothetical protein
MKEGRTILFADQSGFYLLPTVVRTYAPIGQTPILNEHLSHDHLSVMSGITLEGRLLMIEQDRAFKGPDVVRFLKHALSQNPGKLLVIWDGSYGIRLYTSEHERETEFGGIGVLPAGGSLPQGVRSGVANPLAYGLAHVVG